MLWLRRILFGLAVLFLLSTFLNASWLAPSPRGYPQLMAHRGMMQQFSHKGLTDGDCTARRIEPVLHDYLENTLDGLQKASNLGASYLQVDLAPTADGRFVLFHDWTLDCRTQGKGPVRKALLADVQKLDAGWGYTPDGGKTYPFRGKGMGRIATLEEALARFPDARFVFNLKSRDAREGALLAQALVAAGRDVERRGDGFNADEKVLAPLRQRFPRAWAYSSEGVKACTRDYAIQGWLGLTPASCRNGTIMIPLNRQWASAGWPNRLIARMEKVGARVMVIGPYDSEGAPMGLDLPEQVGDIPASFNGVVWVDDMWTIAPALHPAFNKRTPREEQELSAAIERRRAERE